MVCAPALANHHSSRGVPASPPPCRQHKKTQASHAKAREGPIKVGAGPVNTMAWALRERQLPQQARHQEVPKTALHHAHQTQGRTRRRIGA